MTLSRPDVICGQHGDTEMEFYFELEMTCQRDVKRERTKASCYEPICQFNSVVNIKDVFGKVSVMTGCIWDGDWLSGKGNGCGYAAGLVYEALSSCHIHTVESLRVRNSGEFVSDTLEVMLSRLVPVFAFLCSCFRWLLLGGIRSLHRRLTTSCPSSQMQNPKLDEISF